MRLAPAALLLLLTLLTAPTPAHAVSRACAGPDAPGFLYEIGDWEGAGWNRTATYSIADDGTVVALLYRPSGEWLGVASRSGEFLEGGMVLGPSDSRAVGGAASQVPVVSADGRTVVGVLQERLGGVSRSGAAVWRPWDGPLATLLPRAPGATDTSAPRPVAVSADGRRAVGTDAFPDVPTTDKSDLVLWDLEAGTVERPGRFAKTVPVGLSADGRVVAASVWTADGAREVARLAVQDDGDWQTLRIAPALPHASTSAARPVHEARALSADGRTIAGYSTALHPDGPAGSQSAFYSVGWIWTAEGGVELLDVPSWPVQTRTEPLRLLGEWVIALRWVAGGGQQTVAVGTTPATRALGPIPLEDLLVRHYGVEPPHPLAPHLLQIVASSPDAAVVGGAAGEPTGTYLVVRLRFAGDTRERFYKVKLPACADSDRDGLCNEWESAGGIDVDGDGVIDPARDLVLAGANPYHKDLYVEVDRLGDVSFSPEALVDVERAFARVPNSIVGNPDGRDGITLHLEVDEIFYTEGDFEHDTACEPISPSFRWLRLFQFGSAQQRAAGPAVIAAKQQVYRYALIGTKFAPGRDAGGIADLPGNDMLIFPDLYSLPVRTTLAGVLMHELGHTLGLGHGGVDPFGVPDHTNYKPNLASVMNYTWLLPWKRGSTKLSDLWMTMAWRLDYSRAAWPALSEASLDEQRGIGGPPLRPVVVGPWKPKVVSASGPVDFDRDGVVSDAPVAADLNDVDLERDPSPGDELEGSNDWAGVVASGFCAAMRSEDWEEENVEPCRSFAGGRERSAVHCSIGPDTARRLEELELRADCNANGVDDEDELAAGTARDADANGILDACEAGRGDVDGNGRVDEADYLALMAAVGTRLGHPGFPPAGDLEPDGVIAREDLTLLSVLVYGTTACNDGDDNDGDGLVDADDPGCASPLLPLEDPACDDGRDNDGDGLVDAADPQCRPDAMHSESGAAPACGHGPELALLVPLLRAWRRRRKASA